MGTRADFYGEGMEWLGSIAWDGFPDSLPVDVIRSTSDTVFRANVARMLAERDDSTLPERGWPWPWNDSRTTDYAYMVRDGAVHASSFGHEWFRVEPEHETFGEPDSEYDDPKVTDFPDMTARKNVRFDKGSGVIILGGH
jgi:hypothetical protein